MHISSMNRIVLLTLISLAFVSLFFTSCRSTKPQVTFNDITHPKREFRGAWLSTAWQSRYRTMNSQQMKAYFVKTLDQLQADGINAIIFQARPHADAFFKSDIEPWSHLLSGVQGVAPDGGFDPLTFLVDECHKRNMELHAWINPYRVTAGANDVLAPNHIYNREPDRFVVYGGKKYFDPGIPANGQYICKIVKDMLLRYDIDAIHMDDYFYPYPVAGESFPDDRSFNTYAAQQGFGPNQRADWRRNNVNTLIQEIKHTIDQTKPWVRFGISPFGIYRNKRSTPDGSGSQTTGLQNYDDLYADIKLWVDKGWIDYNMPQVYWEIGHTAADYTTLVKWWAEYTSNRHLYIGQDVKRTMDATTPAGNTQLAEKMRQSRGNTALNGNCFWPAYELLDNYKGIADELRSNYHRYPSLIPAYTHMYSKQPKKVGKLKEVYSATEHVLTWTSNADTADPVTAQYYVVYRFEKGEKIDLNRAQNIVTTTRQPHYVLPYEGGNKEYTYVVTAVDRFHNESKVQKKKIKL